MERIELTIYNPDSRGWVRGPYFIHLPKVCSNALFCSKKKIILPENPGAPFVAPETRTSPSTFSQPGSSESWEDSREFIWIGFIVEQVSFQYE
jgi:hypothetical protein